ncbi:hypothetical protein SETIT_5G033800v2 [Setaria italica]|uniref:Uncharacterized protein n=1 Tax=Setaria italica TaxID=4555 RepID=A0A368R0S4_SETIT|nr:hypothetical protein SETIT_5G033800v2 [Setaria italica]
MAAAYLIVGFSLSHRRARRALQGREDQRAERRRAARGSGRRGACFPGGASHRRPAARQPRASFAARELEVDGQPRELLSGRQPPGERPDEHCFCCLASHGTKETRPARQKKKKKRKKRATQERWTEWI